MSEYIEIRIRRGRRFGGKKKKSLVLPAKPPEDIGRRRSTDQLITFYDLGQVNNNASLDDAAVWSDHPILKSPGYGIEAKKFGGHPSGTKMSVVEYQVDPFTDSDYSDFIDRLFTYPVEDWSQRYRQITIPGDGTISDFLFDMRFSVYSGTGTETFVAGQQIDRDALGTGYAAQKETYLATYGRAFDVDKEGAVYRGLSDLTVNYNPDSYPDIGQGGYFGFSTAHKDKYKVTATYDPLDSDVGTIIPRGNIEVYLVPQLAFFAATSNSFDYTLTEVLGLCYQVQPRHLWPRYIDPVTNESGGYGADADVAAYFNYQKNRSGVQYSTWEFFGYDTDPVDPNPIVTESPGDPGDWTGQAQWGLATTPGFTIDASWFASSSRSGPGPSDLETNFDTSFRSSVTDGFYGNDLFQMSGTMLVAVFKMGSQFYYVWDTSGDWSTLQTDNQHERYRLARGVSWDIGLFTDNETTPHDGTGTLWPR